MNEVRTITKWELNEVNASGDYEELMVKGYDYELDNIRPASIGRDEYQGPGGYAHECPYCGRHADGEYCPSCFTRLA